MSELDKAALDRHITGNYGEDQFKTGAWLKCPECEHEFQDVGDNECPECGFSPEEGKEFAECDPPSEDDYRDPDADRKEAGFMD